MEWSEEEEAGLKDAATSVPRSNDAMAQLAAERRAVASRAVELAAARGGAGGIVLPSGAAAALLDERATQSARIVVLAGWLADLTEALLGERPVGVMPSTTLDAARALKAERDTLSQRLTESNQRAEQNRFNQENLRERLENELTLARAERDDLKVERDALARGLKETHRNAKENWEKQEERLQASIRESERLRAERDNWRALWENETRRAIVLEKTGQMLSEHVDRTAGAPLSGPEVARNALDIPDRYPCSPTCTHDDAATPGHPERVNEQSEAFKYTVEMKVGADGVMRDEYARGHNDGAEALRSALLTDVLALLQREGFADGLLASQLKAAIEGAAP